MMSNVKKGLKSFLKYQIEQYIKNVTCSCFLRSRYSDLFEPMFVETQYKIGNSKYSRNKHIISKDENSLSNKVFINNVPIISIFISELESDIENTDEKNALNKSDQNNKHSNIRDILKRTSSGGGLGVNVRNHIELYFYKYLDKCILGKGKTSAIADGFNLYYLKKIKLSTEYPNKDCPMADHVEQLLKREEAKKLCDKVDKLVKSISKNLSRNSDISYLPKKTDEQEKTFFSLQTLFDLYINMEGPERTLQLATASIEILNTINNMDDKISEKSCSEVIDSISLLEIESNPFSPYIEPLKTDTFNEEKELEEWVDKLTEKEFLNKMRSFYKKNKVEVVLSDECVKCYKWFIKEQLIIRKEESISSILAAIYCLQKQSIEKNITVESSLIEFCEGIESNNDLYPNAYTDPTDILFYRTVKRWKAEFSQFIRKKTNGKDSLEFEYEPIKSFIT